MQRNWDEILVKSDYKVTKELLEVFRQKDLAELERGLTRLYQYTQNRAKRDVESDLKNLMELILVWKCDKKMRTPQFSVTIDDLRDNIAYTRRDNDYITDQDILDCWDKEFSHAKYIAGLYYPKKIAKINHLSWHEVFEAEYKVEHHPKPPKDIYTIDFQVMPVVL